MVTDIQNNAGSYFKDYNSAFWQQLYYLSPQILNEYMKDKNMQSAGFSYEQIRKMVAEPQYYELELRLLSFRLYNEVMMYKNLIRFWSSLLEFASEPIPYKKDGSAITLSDMQSNAYKRDFKAVSKFFTDFNVQKEFSKVLWNMCMYDTYFTSIRETDGHIWLQELPASHSIIDAVSYFGYMFSFDFSYFWNPGVNIDGYSDEMKRLFNEARKIRESGDYYNPNYPNRNGKFCCWLPLMPDEAWVFKFNQEFAGAVPPLLGMMMDYAKLGKFKKLGEIKDELEAYKVVVATVPRLTNNRGGNRVDNFSISASEVGKFVAQIKSTFPDGVDFKAAPLEDFKLLDFSPNSKDSDIVNQALNSIAKQSGLSPAISLTDHVNMASASIFRAVTGAEMSKLYSQFEDFLNYQLDKRTKTYKFKIKLVGTIFDKEERIKQSNEDMTKGLITPQIFSSRNIQITDSVNTINMMYNLGVPEMFRPVQISSTLSGSAGRPEKSDGELSDSGANTRTADGNNNS